MNFDFYIGKDESLNLECDWDGIGDFDELQVIEELECEDIEHITSSIDGWSYWYDRNSDIVYLINDHHYNKMSELRDTGEAQLFPHENSQEDYEGYEWNEDRDWKVKE